MPLKMKLVRKDGKPLGSFGTWIQAFRLHYVPTSIFPALLGSVIAWAAYDKFNLLYFVMVVIGVTVHHVGLNMIDDVFDYLHAVDRSQGEEKNPYTGGSGVLTGGLLPAEYVLAAAIVCYLIGIAIAICLTVLVGWPVLIFAAIGVFSSVFYTMPPIQIRLPGLRRTEPAHQFRPRHLPRRILCADTND